MGSSVPSSSRARFRRRRWCLPLCAACYYEKREPDGLVLWHARDWRLAGGSAEERFEALLEAARVFWRALLDGSPHEVEEIFTTLRLAHKIGEQGMGMFGYRGVRLSDVLEGIPILEQPRVRVSSPETSLSTPSTSLCCGPDRSPPTGYRGGGDRRGIQEEPGGSGRDLGCEGLRHNVWFSR